MEEGRRNFFKNFFKEALRGTLKGIKEAEEESREEESLDEFFDSYESSYALTLNYPDDILLESARMEGIEVEGRDRIDIVKEMFRKKGGL